MMAYYFVKTPLWGIPAGHCGLFNDRRAAVLMAEGALEKFDPKNKRHVEAEGSPQSDAKARERAAVKTAVLQKAQRELHARQYGTK